MSVSKFQSTGNASQIFHDTAGWRNLETSMKALENMINGSASHFLPFIDQVIYNFLKIFKFIHSMYNIYIYKVLIYKKQTLEIIKLTVDIL